MEACRVLSSAGFLRLGAGIQHAKTYIHRERICNILYGGYLFSFIAEKEAQFCLDMDALDLDSISILIQFRVLAEVFRCLTDVGKEM